MPPFGDAMPGRKGPQTISCHDSTPAVTHARGLTLKASGTAE
jgi:hypothetical protein